jgi:MHS family alpha-ketoglutarate permease-like MFS transporter
MSSTLDHGNEAPPARETPDGDRATSRSVVSTCVGNALEWFDWSIYATFAPFFAVQFFHPGDELSAFLSTLAVFAIGFLARPLGGFVFGWLADRRGRKLSMCATVALAALGSLVIGLAPTYAAIGVFSSVLLLVARVVQGLAHGGELPAAQTYLSESAPAKRRGLWSSLIYVSGTLGAVCGILLGALMTGLLSKADMAAYGWRVPFVIGGITGLLALYMRARMRETPQFEETAGKAAKRPAGSLWREVVRHRGQAGRVIGLTVGITVAYYVFAVATPGYAIAAMGLDPTSALTAAVASNAVFILLLPLWGMLSDRIGRKPVMLIGAAGSAVMAFPMSALLQDSAWQLFFAMTGVQVFLAASAAIGPAVYAEMFPTSIRTVGMALPYSVAVALFGGTAPYLQTRMVTEYGAQSFTGYVVLLLLVSVVVIIRMPETRAKEL